MILQMFLCIIMIKTCITNVIIINQSLYICFLFFLTINVQQLFILLKIYQLWLHVIAYHLVSFKPAYH